MELNKTNTGDAGQWVNKIHCGDCLDLLRSMPDCTVNCVVTSPPYY
jgi:DNA modification methylase